MANETRFERPSVLRFHRNNTALPSITEIDWDQFENCQTCRGRAAIDETPEGELICQQCKAHLPKPAT